jgi:hypothetical protein
MLKLNLNREPYWLDLPSEVRVKVRPLTSAIFNAARAYMTSQLAAHGAVDDPHQRQALAEDYLIRGLARFAIEAWEGVLEADSDSPADPTPERIDEVMANFWHIATAFGEKYTQKHTLLEQEKNASSVASSGISAAARNTAKTA